MHNGFKTAAWTILKSAAAAFFFWWKCAKEIWIQAKQRWLVPFSLPRNNPWLHSNGKFQSVLQKVLQSSFVSLLIWEIVFTELHYKTITGKTPEERSDQSDPRVIPESSQSHPWVISQCRDGKCVKKIAQTKIFNQKTSTKISCLFCIQSGAS